MWSAIFINLIDRHQNVISAIRWWLLGGDVLATWMVGAGILWESQSLNINHRIARRFVFIGVVLETLCSVALFAFDDQVSDAQQSKIIALDTRLDAAAKALLPRRLLTGQRDADILQREAEVKRYSALKLEGPKFPSTVPQNNRVFIQAVLGSEPQELESDLIFVLNHLGWDAHPATDTDTQGAQDIREGASVFFPVLSSNELQDNANKLAAGLTSIGLADRDGGEVKVFREIDASLPGMPKPPRGLVPGILFITIGSQPIDGMLRKILLKAPPAAAEAP